MFKTTTFLACHISLHTNFILKQWSYSINKLSNKMQHNAVYL